MTNARREALCRRLADELRATGSATDAEIAAVWPGGALNTLAGRRSWELCAGYLSCWRMLDGPPLALIDPPNLPTSFFPASTACH